MRTLNEHITLFESFKNQHGQIRSFGFGDPWEQQETNKDSGDLDYPLMFVVLDGSNVSGNELTNSYTIGFFDKVQKGEENELETLSDCQRLALDFIAWCDKMDDLWEDHNIEPESQLQDYTEHTSDWIAGFTATVRIKQAFTKSACNIPGISYNPTDGETCEPATVLLNGEFYSEVVSGGTLNVIGGDTGGTINVYLDGVLQSSTSSTDLDAEIVNILWT